MPSRWATQALGNREAVRPPTVDQAVPCRPTRGRDVPYRRMSVKQVFLKNACLVDMSWGEWPGDGVLEDGSG
jgi:hypothetical protein